jgi:hypothetical protein
VLQGMSLVSTFIGNTMNTFVPSAKPQTLNSSMHKPSTFGAISAGGVGDVADNAVTVQAQQQVLVYLHALLLV